MTDLNRYVLSRLSEAELELLEHLLKKAAGEIVGDVIPEIRVVRELVDTAEPTADVHHSTT